MHYDENAMIEFDKRVSQGLIRRVFRDNLVLFNYTDACTFERAWDEYTLVSRGIVIDRRTGEVVARPLSKFFNMNETEEVSLSKLPVDKGYHVFEKLDGSLGIIYFYEGQWHLNTRGSFDSPQAIKGRSMLNDYRVRYLDERFTYLVEIIYPENKIVVDYGSEEKLVLLGAVHTASGKEVSPEIIGYVAEQLGMECATMYPYTIEEMIELQNTLTKDQEGFVVRFANGLRVKIKGDEYMKIARLISNMTPLAFWEAMKDGTVSRQYLAQLPEEFRKDYEPIVRELEMQYNAISMQIMFEYLQLPEHDKTSEGRRIVGLFIRDNPDLIRSGAMMFAILDGKWAVLDEYIKKKMRPKNNELIRLDAEPKQSRPESDIYLYGD
jgi:RNA ligase